VINEAYTHLRRRRYFQPLDSVIGTNEQCPREVASTEANPEQMAIRAQMCGTLESKIASLPRSYRVVISLRVLREMPVADTAAYLGISEQGGKSRLLRAKRMLQGVGQPARRELRENGQHARAVPNRPVYTKRCLSS